MPQEEGSVFLEFSFHLHTLNLGTTDRSGTNPFTGEAVDFHEDEGLTDDQIDGVQDVLDEYGFDGPEEDGEGYALYGDDGSSIRFRYMDLESGDAVCNVPVEITVPRITKDVLTILREVATAGGFALTSFTGEHARLIGASPTAAHRNRWPDVQSLRSMTEFRDWLVDTIGYREVPQ